MIDNATISEIKNCSFTKGNSYTWNYRDSDKLSRALELLSEKAAPGAFHVSNERYNPPRCHQKTRLVVLQDLMDVIRGTVASRVIWLYGAAGAGKSAIAQSFAETCQEEGLLIGTFFFSRTALWRNNVQRLAASLAYQLTRAIPLTIPFIEHAIISQPAIFSSSFEDQIDQLFVQPLRRACEKDPTQKFGPKLVILDGLDECNTADVQKDIITVLQKALQHTPFPIVVLVASRPEIHIKSTFESIDNPTSIQILHFDLNDSLKYDADTDIRLYLNDKFDKIKRDHPFKKYLPEAWPLSSDVDLIIAKSSGQFIFAATVIRYIEHDQCKPHERLQTALDASKRFASTVHDSPFKELDALYFQIFSGVQDRITALAILYLALDVRGERIGHAQWPQTIAFRLGFDLSDVELDISSLASLMKFEAKDKPFRVFHATLRDFLVDERRSGNLYIEQPAVHTMLSKAYLRHFLHSASGFYDVLDFCSYHIPRAELDEQMSVLMGDVERKMPEFIKTTQSDQGNPLWYDHGSFSDGTSTRDRYFCDLIQSVHSLKDAILGKAPENTTLWDKCLDGIYQVFKQNLSVFLSNETSHDYLALVVFTNGDEFPHSDFTSNWDKAKSTWKTCRNVDIFRSCDGPKPFHDIPRQVLRNFLLDPDHSESLYVGPEQFARVAFECLKMVNNTSVSWDISNNRGLTHEEEFYLWSVRSTICMLQKASKSQHLIDALKSCNCQLQWLAHFSKDAQDARYAMDFYLETHSPKSPATGATELDQSCELPSDYVAVDHAVDGDRPVDRDPSTGHRGRKRSRGVLSSLGKLFTTKSNKAEGSQNSPQQGKKKKKKRKSIFGRLLLGI